MTYAKPERDGRDLWNGARLKEVRDARGLSQEQLGEAAGIGGAEVSRHERNASTSNPTVAVLGRLARALRIPLSVLCDSLGAPIPRPGEEPGHGAGVERNPILDQRFAELLGKLDAEAPAADSWRGDVLKALAALTRALRREDPGDSDQRATKAGR